MTYQELQRRRKMLLDLAEIAKQYQLPIFAVTDGASITRNNGSEAVRHAREMHAQWEDANGGDSKEDWQKTAAISSELLERLAKKYYPAEGSHGWNHIEDVRARAKEMVSTAGQKWRPDMEAAALFHDSGLYPNGFTAGEDRIGHEDRGAEIARSELEQYFTKKRLARIMAAIREHRGSYKGTYTSPLSDLISSADRGRPDINAKIRRSVQYNFEKYPDSTPDEVYAQVAAFLPTKYGINGYGRLPKYYRQTYKNELTDFQKQVMYLTPSVVKTVMETEQK